MAQLPFDVNSLNTQDMALYESMLKARKDNGAPFDGPYLPLMNHPELCQKLNDLGFFLKFKGHLDRKIYQFVVLSIAHASKSKFEWDDHINHAIAAGVPQQVIETLQTYGVSSGDFPPPFINAAKVLNSTLVYKNISDEVQTDAIRSYGMLGFIEIVVLSGFYQMFAAINEGFDVGSIPRNSIS